MAREIRSKRARHWQSPASPRAWLRQEWGPGDGGSLLSGHLPSRSCSTAAGDLPGPAWHARSLRALSRRTPPRHLGVWERGGWSVKPVLIGLGCRSNVSEARGTAHAGALLRGSQEQSEDVQLASEPWGCLQRVRNCPGREREEPKPRQLFTPGRAGRREDGPLQDLAEPGGGGGLWCKSSSLCAPLSPALSHAD